MLSVLVLRIGMLYVVMLNAVVVKVVAPLFLLLHRCRMEKLLQKEQILH
jgi:hypothetical protein